MNVNIYKLGSQSAITDNFARITFLIKVFIFIYKKDYDILHPYVYLPAFTAKIIMILKKKPVVLSIFGTSINSDLTGSFRKLIEKIILLKIKYTAQITDSRNFLKLKNVNKTVVYIPHGVNLELFNKVKGNKYSRFTILTVARLHPQKNLENLIRAFAKVKNKISYPQLYIVGDGPEKQNLKALINELDLDKDVKLLGVISGNELIKIYKSCHLFILASLYEGQPISLLEAWAAKLPVIVSKTGDCQYLVKNEINGYQIDNQLDPSSIAKIIVDAVQNKKLEELGKNGFNLIKNKYNWEKSAEKVYDLYKKSLNN